MTYALAALTVFLFLLVYEARRTIQRLQRRLRAERRARRRLEDERRMAGVVRVSWRPTEVRW